MLLLAAIHWLALNLIILTKQLRSTLLMENKSMSLQVKGICSVVMCRKVKFDHLDKAFCVMKLSAEQCGCKNKWPQKVFRVDLIVAPPKQYACALLSWTGSKVSLTSTFLTLPELHMHTHIQYTHHTHTNTPHAHTHARAHAHMHTNTILILGVCIFTAI